MLPIYDLTAEQTEIQKLARDFSQREILPSIASCEKDALKRSNLVDKIRESSLVNTRIPEEFGGLGLSLIDTCLINNEIASICSGIGSIVEASELAISYLLICGTDEQKTQFLKPLAQNNALAGLAIFNSYKNISKPVLRVEQSKSKAILNGHCPLVLNASFADWFLIACPYKENSPDELAYFVVPKNIAGIKILESPHLLGRKASDARSIHFENVELEPIFRINNADKQAASVNAAIISSGCLGIGSAAFNYAKKYAQERQTFGVPIAKHQAISFMMAEMSTDLAAGLMMIYRLLESISGKHNNWQLALFTQTFTLGMISEMTINAVQIFGGYGYTKDYPVEKLMRDAKTYRSFYCYQ